MKPLISLLLVEPSSIIREGLRTILSQSGQFNLLAPLSDASNLDKNVRTSAPDLLVVNPTLLTSSLHLSEVRQQRPNMAVVGLVYQYVDPQTLQQFKSILDIREPQNNIVQLLADSCSETASQAATESYDLSSRETEVLVLLTRGLSSKEIADKLCISVNTVNTHRKSITRKTGIKSVAGLAVYATLQNLT